MRRCFGRTRNLRRCGRHGNWKFFCSDHKRQPLVWSFVLVFTVLAGTASIYSAWFAGNAKKERQAQEEQDQQTKAPEASSPSQAKSNEGLDDASIAASDPSFSPISMEEFFNTAKSMSLTDLQRSDFISQHTDRRVIWEGSISTVSDRRNEIVIGLTDFKSDWVYLALFSFPTDHRSDFLALKPGQKIRVTGIIREWHVTITNLDSSRILKIFPSEDQTSNSNAK